MAPKLLSGFTLKNALLVSLGAGVLACLVTAVLFFSLDLPLPTSVTPASPSPLLPPLLSFYAMVFLGAFLLTFTSLAIFLLQGLRE